MLYSMTGYGRTEQSIGDKTFIVELRSLNGKQFDLRLQMPAMLKPFEFDIRSMLSESLERGSIECIINLKQNGGAKPVTINTDLLKAYYTSVVQIAHELNAEADHLLAAVLRLPEVVVNTTEVMTDEEWVSFKKILDTALQQLKQHRLQEGKSIEKDLLLRLQNIEAQQKQIAALEPLRREKIRENIVKLLEEWVGKDNYDSNRLEQELIYYIEKIDISEEQVRLQNHCHYFRSIIEGRESSKGKKLSFILQEFGREINTTGSKANDAAIQKCVVLMKDELEKAKEQVLNVL
ncbi:MAG: YicC family protein [Hydrotalea sp. AMD]|uniref:YicC/YloC family endoribonuclease n=1 Tax=Hydrotalea sp. AMD TaxID=2501297 RepID=UPI000944F034|nr:YicC/YloC family endoribonuclease [Hydrotalea sp. AMD]RWZ88092.1 MAG: YicC family protein [Hydrotalea sp. AMD]